MKLNDKVVAIPPAASILINQIVYDKRQLGEKVYTYSLGEAFFEIPRFDITDEEFVSGYHYSSSLGQLLLRKKIAELYQKYYQVGVEADSEVLISAGSKVIIYMLLMTIINPGDEVLVSEPSWLSYKEQISLANGVYVGIPFTENINQWEKYITDKTRIIVINNPNNPSGYLYSESELSFLLNLAKKYNLIILSDEAYSDFLLKDDKFISILNLDKHKEHSIVVNSLSKNMGMSGWRVGYAIANKIIISQLLKLNQHLITCAPTLLQDYLAKNFDSILEHTIPQARQMAEKRKQVQLLINEHKLNVLPGIGTFYFMIDVSKFPGSTDELVLELLFNHNIATVSGSAYGISTSDFIRFGIGVENLNDINKSLSVISSYLRLDKYDNKALRKQLTQSSNK